MAIFSTFAASFRASLTTLAIPIKRTLKSSSSQSAGRLPESGTLRRSPPASQWTSNRDSSSQQCSSDAMSISSDWEMVPCVIPSSSDESHYNNKCKGEAANNQFEDPATTKGTGSMSSPPQSGCSPPTSHSHTSCETLPPEPLSLEDEPMFDLELNNSTSDEVEQGTNGPNESGSAESLSITGLDHSEAREMRSGKRFNVSLTNPVTHFPYKSSLERHPMAVSHQPVQESYMRTMASPRVFMHEVLATEHADQPSQFPELKEGGLESGGITGGTTECSGTTCGVSAISCCGSTTVVVGGERGGFSHSSTTEVVDETSSHDGKDRATCSSEDNGEGMNPNSSGSEGDDKTTVPNFTTYPEDIKGMGNSINEAKMKQDNTAFFEEVNNVVKSTAEDRADEKGNTSCEEISLNNRDHHHHHEDTIEHNRTRNDTTSEDHEDSELRPTSHDYDECDLGEDSESAEILDMEVDGNAEENVRGEIDDDGFAIVEQTDTLKHTVEQEEAKDSLEGVERAGKDDEVVTVVPGSAGGGDEPKTTHEVTIEQSSIAWECLSTEVTQPSGDTTEMDAESQQQSNLSTSVNDTQNTTQIRDTISEQRQDSIDECNLDATNTATTSIEETYLTPSALEQKSEEYSKGVEPLISDICGENTLNLSEEESTMEDHNGSRVHSKNMNVNSELVTGVSPCHFSVVVSAAYVLATLTVHDDFHASKSTTAIILTNTSSPQRHSEPTATVSDNVVAAISTQLTLPFTMCLDPWLRLGLSICQCQARICLSLSSFPLSFTFSEVTLPCTSTRHSNLALVKVKKASPASTQPQHGHNQLIPDNTNSQFSLTSPRTLHPIHPECLALVKVKKASPAKSYWDFFKFYTTTVNGTCALNRALTTTRTKQLSLLGLVPKSGLPNTLTFVHQNKLKLHQVSILKLSPLNTVILCHAMCRNAAIQKPLASCVLERNLPSIHPPLIAPALNQQIAQVFPPDMILWWRTGESFLTDLNQPYYTAHGSSSWCGLSNDESVTTVTFTRPNDSSIKPPPPCHELKFRQLSTEHVHRFIVTLQKIMLLYSRHNRCRPLCISRPSCEVECFSPVGREDRPGFSNTAEVMAITVPNTSSSPTTPRHSFHILVAWVNQHLQISSYSPRKLFGVLTAPQLETSTSKPMTLSLCPLTTTFSSEMPRIVTLLLCQASRNGVVSVIQLFFIHEWPHSISSTQPSSTQPSPLLPTSILVKTTDYAFRGPNIQSEHKYEFSICFMMATPPQYYRWCPADSPNQCGSLYQCNKGSSFWPSLLRFPRELCSAPQCPSRAVSALQHLHLKTCHLGDGVHMPPSSPCSVNLLPPRTTTSPVRFSLAMDNVSRLFSNTLSPSTLTSHNSNLLQTLTNGRVSPRYSLQHAATHLPFTPVVEVGSVGESLHCLPQLPPSRQYGNKSPILCLRSFLPSHKFNGRDKVRPGKYMKHNSVYRGVSDSDWAYNSFFVLLSLSRVDSTVKHQFLLRLSMADDYPSVEGAFAHNFSVAESVTHWFTLVSVCHSYGSKKAWHPSFPRRSKEDQSPISHSECERHNMGTSFSPPFQYRMCVPSAGIPVHPARPPDIPRDLPLDLHKQNFRTVSSPNKDGSKISTNRGGRNTEKKRRKVSGSGTGESTSSGGTGNMPPPPPPPTPPGGGGGGGGGDGGRKDNGDDEKKETNEQGQETEEEEEKKEEEERDKWEVQRHTGKKPNTDDLLKSDCHTFDQPPPPSSSPKRSPLDRAGKTPSSVGISSPSDGHKPSQSSCKSQIQPTADDRLVEDDEDPSNHKVEQSDDERDHLASGGGQQKEEHSIPLLQGDQSEEDDRDLLDEPPHDNLGDDSGQLHVKTEGKGDHQSENKEEEEKGCLSGGELTTNGNTEEDNEAGRVSSFIPVCQPFPSLEDESDKNLDQPDDNSLRPPHFSIPPTPTPSPTPTTPHEEVVPYPQCSATTPPPPPPSPPTTTTPPHPPPPPSPPTTTTTPTTPPPLYTSPPTHPTPTHPTPPIHPDSPPISSESFPIHVSGEQNSGSAAVVSHNQLYNFPLHHHLPPAHIPLFPISRWSYCMRSVSPTSDGHSDGEECGSYTQDECNSLDHLGTTSSFVIEQLSAPGFDFTDSGDSDFGKFFDRWESLDKRASNSSSDEEFFDAQEYLDHESSSTSSGGEERSQGEMVAVEEETASGHPGKPTQNCRESTSQASPDNAVSEPPMVVGSSAFCPVRRTYSRTEVVITTSLVATLCILTHEDVVKLADWRPRETLGHPYTSLPGLASVTECGPLQTVGDLCPVHPVQEQPFLMGVYRELRNTLRLVFTNNQLQDQDLVPLDQYLEQALQNGNLTSGVRILYQLINCVWICTMWGRHFSLEEDGVYVDAEGVQLVANVSVCIGAQLDCSLDSQQATIERLRSMFIHLLQVLQQNDRRTTEVRHAIHLLTDMIQCLTYDTNLNTLHTYITTVHQNLT